MKKFLFLFFMVFIFSFTVHGQPMLVMDVSLNGIMAESGIAQAIYYAQMIEDTYTQIVQTTKMIENMVTQAERTAQNLASAKNIKSWDDAMDFYNRQVYLEKQTAAMWDKMNIKIGKKEYHISQIEDIAYGAKDTYIDYWAKEFTEEQNKEMWLGLGLTPANYAYLHPFREKGKELIHEGLTAFAIQNDYYTAQMERNKEIRDLLLIDQYKPTEAKMGSKEITMMILESLLDTNKVMNDIAMNQAKEREEKAVQAMINNAPNNNPPISDWSKIGFEELE